MNNPIPNSPEFARLARAQQYNILKDRVKVNAISQDDLWWRGFEESVDESKPLWPTAAAEAEALKHWNVNSENKQ